MLTNSGLQNWLYVAPAIFLAVLSGYLSERVGIVNIAINGAMTFGAFFFTLFSNFFAPDANAEAPIWSMPISFILSIICSAAIGILFGFAAIKLKADHVIAGTGINLLAPGIGLYLGQNVQKIFHGITDFRMRYNPKVISAGGNDITKESIILFVFSLLVILFIWYLMRFTKTGLRYKVVGENPNVLDSLGINVYKYQWLGIISAFAIAGFSGSLFSLFHPSFSGDVNGLGFVALALLIVSNWLIIPNILISLFFAYLYVKLQTLLSLDQGKQIVIRTIPFIVSLAVMVLFSAYNIGPKNVGRHFNKEHR